ncbi:MAG: FliH/SctL family protein [Nitrospirota bacterium]
MKRLLYKDRGTPDKDITPYKMPILEKGAEEVSAKVKEQSINESTATIEREAYEKGFEVGEKAGYSVGEQKAAVLIETLGKIIESLVNFRESLTREIEPQLVCLSLSIARKIIRKELTTNPEEIVEITKEALTRLGRIGPITIKINPSLFDLFMKHKPELLAIHSDLFFDVDPSVSQNGTVAVGSVEEIVTDVDEQLKNLIREMGLGLDRD